MDFHRPLPPLRAHLITQMVGVESIQRLDPLANQSAKVLRVILENVLSPLR